MASWVAFWGILGVLSLFILWGRETTQEVFLPDAPAGYRFTFEEMRLHDHTRDSTTLIYAKEAAYDRRHAQVTLAAPAIIQRSTAQEDRWRVTAGQGVADVPHRTDLFPSTLGDIRMTSDVVIVDLANDRVLSTSGVVSYLAADRVFYSTDRTRVRWRRSTVLFPYGFLMEVQAGLRVTQGRPGADPVGEYRQRKQSRQDASANGRGNHE